MTAYTERNGFLLDARRRFRVMSAWGIVFPVRNREARVTCAYASNEMVIEDADCSLCGSVPMKMGE